MVNDPQHEPVIELAQNLRLNVDGGDDPVSGRRRNKPILQPLRELDEVALRIEDADVGVDLVAESRVVGEEVAALEETVLRHHEVDVGAGVLVRCCLYSDSAEGDRRVFWKVDHGVVYPAHRV